MFKLWLKLRVKWSNFINKDDIRDYHVTEVFTTLKGLKEAIVNLYNNFEYTYDKASELFDSMHSPAQCYYNCYNGKLKDDCDGFHAAAYHILSKNRFNCYLLTYITTKLIDSHTVLMFKRMNKYYICDYYNYYSADTFEGVFDQLLAARKTTARCYNIIKYNYNEGKYIIVEGE